MIEVVIDGKVLIRNIWDCEIKKEAEKGNMKAYKYCNSCALCDDRSKSRYDHPFRDEKRD